MVIRSKRVRVYARGESADRRTDLGPLLAYDITLKGRGLRKRRALIPRNLTEEERVQWRNAQREIPRLQKTRRNERGIGWESRVYAVGPLALKVFTTRNIIRMFRKRNRHSIKINKLFFREPSPISDRLRWLLKSLFTNREVTVAKEHMRAHALLTEWDIPTIKLIGALERGGLLFPLIENPTAEEAKRHYPWLTRKVDQALEDLQEKIIAKGTLIELNPRNIFVKVDPALGTVEPLVIIDLVDTVTKKLITKK